MGEILGRHANEKFDSKIKASWFYPDDPFEFVSLDYQRTLSLHHINKLIKSLKEQLEAGEVPHFKKPFIVNIRNDGKIVLLDGYHRWEAMKKFGQVVKVKLEIYEGLSIKEEIKIYRDYNIQRNHSLMDMIRPVIDDMPAMKYLERNSKIPLTRYSNAKRGITLTSYLNSYKQQILDGKNYPLMEYMTDIFSVEDAQKLVKWSAWYVETVGAYHRRSDFYHRNFISVAMHIFWNTLRLDVYESRIKKFVFDAEIKQILNTSSGFSGFKVLLPAIKSRINKQLKRPII